MPYRKIQFYTNGYYHIFNRGVEKRDIFLGDKDYQRFFDLIEYYRFFRPYLKFSIYLALSNDAKVLARQKLSAALQYEEAAETFQPRVTLRN